MTVINDGKTSVQQSYRQTPAQKPGNLGVGQTSGATFPGGFSDLKRGIEIMQERKGCQMEIAKIMHSPADWVDANTAVAEVARLMKASDIGALPVGRNDRLIGMVTDRDLALRVLGEGRDPAMTTAEQVMTPGIVWCLTTQTVEDAMHMMEQKKIRRLPVIDEKKRLVGMLSIGDIADAMPRQLLGEVVNAVADHHT